VKPTTAASLPNDVATLKAMLLAERAVHRAELEKLRLTIAKLRHERFVQSSEGRALLEQLELQLFEVEEDQAQAGRKPRLPPRPAWRWHRSSAASRHAAPCRSIFRASASSMQRRLPARAAAARCTSSART